MEKKERSYLIKVPVFTTKNQVSSDEFPEMNTYDDMVNIIKSKVGSFQNEMSFENKNKTKQTFIDSITYTQHKLSYIPCLLLQISAYKTNLYDVCLKSEKEDREITKGDKLASTKHFALIYPIINGMNSNEYTKFFLVLIYEDPTKDSDDIIKIVKFTLKEILKIPIKNIKLDKVLEELKSYDNIQELEIEFSSLIMDNNEVDVGYRKYVTKISKLQNKIYNFKDIPLDKTIELVNNNEEGFQKKRIKIKNGKKEYRISSQIQEVAEELTGTAEKIFNESISITQEELDKKLYETTFIIEKLNPILTNYLESEQN
jgi:hypothetical protein